MTPQTTQISTILQTSSAAPLEPCDYLEPFPRYSTWQLDDCIRSREVYFVNNFGCSWLVLYYWMLCNV